MDGSDKDNKPKKNYSPDTRHLEQQKEHEDGIEDVEDEEGKLAEVAPEQTHAPVFSRTSFTNLSQVHVDLALSRTLQEQKMAYVMMSMVDGEFEVGREYEIDYEDGRRFQIGDHWSSEGSDFDDEEYTLEAEEHEDEINDEAYTRALHAVDERNLTLQLMALADINNCEMMYSCFLLCCIAIVIQLVPNI